MNSLSSALQTLGEQFAQSEATLKTLQVAVSDLINDSETQSFESLTHLQALDRITQELADFSSFTLALSEIIPSETVVDIGTATSKMHMFELASRLCGFSTAPDDPQERDIDILF